jgi:hypothetical protein
MRTFSFLENDYKLQNDFNLTFWELNFRHMYIQTTYITEKYFSPAFNVNSSEFLYTEKL